jgi:hypothetical protein
MVKEPQRLPRYVTPEHFDLIYTRACDFANLPNDPGQGFSASDWWRGLAVTAYMTGLIHDPGDVVYSVLGRIPDPAEDRP